LPEGDLERFNLKDISIKDFFDKLPQQTFSLAEWINFVDHNQHYLTINNKDHLSIKAITMSVSIGLENVSSVVTPLEMMKGKSLLSRENFFKSTAL